MQDGRMAIGAWSLDPAWQNFSSLYREARSAEAARTALEYSHHLTAALYFGIAAIEAHRNRAMRRHMAPAHSESEIARRLRSTKFSDKLTKWPVEITGRDSKLDEKVVEFIRRCNDVRGDLTHPKFSGRETYEKLFEVEPLDAVDAVAQCIVAFHEMEGTRYPYWIFGWNYLNPRPDSYEIVLFNEQQFCFALRALGWRIDAWDVAAMERWLPHNFGTVEGYKAIRAGLLDKTHCEPKSADFPFQPKLCREWWSPEHQGRCGHVSQEAMRIAVERDDARAEIMRQGAESHRAQAPDTGRRRRGWWKTVAEVLRSGGSSRRQR